VPLIVALPNRNSRALARLVCRLERMTDLIHPPRLVWPTTTVRDSYLAGERADCLARDTPTDLVEVLNAASEDFDTFVAQRRGVHTRWDVPSTIYWYVSGGHYIGTLVVRHRLTPELAEVGGHVGYHVVAPWQRQGHATRMLAAGLVECRRLGIDRVLLTCATDNEPSRRVILANGGVFDGLCRGEDRYWIALTPPEEIDPSPTADGS
jgi:predicted acetyltransferase